MCINAVMCYDARSREIDYFRFPIVKRHQWMWIKAASKYRDRVTSPFLHVWHKEDNNNDNYMYGLALFYN